MQRLNTRSNRGKLVVQRLAKKPVMDSEHFDDMSKLVAAYSIKNLHDFRTLYFWLQQNGKGLTDLWDYLDDHPKRQVRENYNQKVCPECGQFKYELRNICTPKGPANLNGFKHQWYCDNCGHYEYGIQSVKEIMSIEAKKRFEDGSK